MEGPEPYPTGQHQDMLDDIVLCHRNRFRHDSNSMGGRARDSDSCHLPVDSLRQSGSSICRLVGRMTVDRLMTMS